MLQALSERYISYACGTGYTMDWDGTAAIIAALSASIAYITYIYQRDTNEVSFIHSTFRDFLKLDYELRCDPEIPDIKKSRLIDASGNIIFSPEIITGTQVEEAIDASKGNHRRLVGIKLYTMEEIFINIHKRERRVYKFLGYLTVYPYRRIYHRLRYNRFYRNTSEYWKETIKVHIQDDPILVARDIDLYGNCYHADFIIFVKKDCRIGVIIDKHCSVWRASAQSAP